MQQTRNSYFFHSSKSSILTQYIDQKYVYDKHDQLKIDDQRQFVQNTSIFPYNCIGLLKIKNSNKFGTGFLISPNLILTVAHNIFNMNSRVYYKPQQIQFYVGGRFRSFDKKYVLKNYRIKRQFKKYFNKQSVFFDFALLQLNEKIPFQRFLSLKSDYLFTGEQEEISMIGYCPQKIKEDRVLPLMMVKGSVILRLQNSFHIFYRFTTVPGQSGSPILIKDKNEGYNVIGLHNGGASDKCHNFNSGTFMTQRIIFSLRLWDREMQPSQFSATAMKMNQEIDLNNNYEGALEKEQDLQIIDEKYYTELQSSKRIFENILSSNVKNMTQLSKMKGGYTNYQGPYKVSSNIRINGLFFEKFQNEVEKGVIISLESIASINKIAMSIKYKRQNYLNSIKFGVTSRSEIQKNNPDEIYYQCGGDLIHDKDYLRGKIQQRIFNKTWKEDEILKILVDNTTHKMGWFIENKLNEVIQFQFQCQKYYFFVELDSKTGKIEHIL